MMYRGCASNIRRPGAQKAIGLWLGSQSRSISIPGPRAAKQMPPRPKAPDDSEFSEAFLKGTGPGGQKINKTNSAVQLKHHETGIVVKVQETRSRTQNRKLARQLLAERLEALEKGDESRAAIVAEVKRKKKANASKKSKKKYRALDEAKKAAAEAEEGQQGEEAEAPVTEDIPPKLP